MKGGFVPARSIRVSLATLLAAVLPLVACQTSDNTNNTPLQPTVVQPTLTTKTFPGTVAAGGQTNTNFTTAEAGSLAVTLTAAGPPSNITMRVGLGQPATTDSTQCVVNNLFLDTAASATPQISLTVAAGNYCVAIRDIGMATGPVSYTFTVTGAFGTSEPRETP
ncbi:MAG TPA: hypothetical protein VKH42_17935 [Vicinamibacterales bacterium]|nr:hypothetical protein [Vicinamibacterales bacterium]